MNLFSSHDSASSIAAVTKLAEEKICPTLSMEVNKHQPPSAQRVRVGATTHSGGLGRSDWGLRLVSGCFPYSLFLETPGALEMLLN